MARENDTRCAKKKKGKKNEQLETIRNLGMIRSDETYIGLLYCVIYIYIYIRGRGIIICASSDYIKSFSFNEREIARLYCSG